MKETLESIQKYLEKVRNAVDSGKYSILHNTKNSALIDKYLVDEAKSKEIIKSVQAEDFSEIVTSEDPRFAGDFLYVFGKQVELIRRVDFGTDLADLYIKFDNDDPNVLIVMSLHEQENQINYLFKK